MKEINIRDIKESPVSLISDGWGLVAAGNENGFNMMTVSWGAFGELWNKDAVFVFIRPQRHTFSYTEKEDLFTLSFYPEQYREALTVCGRTSGRDGDKAEKAGLTPLFTDGTVTFREAKYTLVCRKVAGQYLSPESFIDPAIGDCYDGDYHKMYVGEILKVYENT